MNILISGIHGFVGANLVASLRQRHTLYGLDIIAPEKEGVVRTFAWDDLAKKDALPKFDAIIHLAGKAHDTKNRSQAQTYFDINTGLTQRIFDYFTASECKKFIFFSSVKAAADKVEGEMLTEEVVPKPVGPYGESKIKAEEYIFGKLRNMNEGLASQSVGKDILPPPIDSVRKEGKNQTKQVYILRPCMIHGPGNKGNLNLLYGVVKRGIPWPLGEFENRRSFTSIDNLSFVIEGLLTKSVPSGIYHMADDEALSTNELICTMCRAMNRKARIMHLPKGWMQAMARLGGVLHLPLNPDRLQKLTENYVVSNAKLKRALGIDRMPVRAEEGIEKTISSFGEPKA